VVGELKAPIATEDGVVGVSKRIPPSSHVASVLIFLQVVVGVFLALVRG
jgi:hypothetical protein